MRVEYELFSPFSFGASGALRWVVPNHDEELHCWRSRHGICHVSMRHPDSTRAGLSGPPASFVVPARDSQHVFVMLSPAPVSKDDGNDCTLPTGEQVKLRDVFPTSGLYAPGSTTPIWTVDWYGEQGLVHISTDGRFLVRVNRFGDGSYPIGALSWGIKFYDNGVEIASYDVRHLVDHPSLMPMTTADWHMLWIDDSSVYDSEIHGSFFDLATSTHEWYRFEVTTGRIVQEYRLWRNVRRRSIVATGVAVAIGCLLFYRFRKRARCDSPMVTPQVDYFAEQSEPVRKPIYSLRSLMIVVTAVGIACVVPHICVLLLGMVAVVLSTRHLIRTRRRFAGLRKSRAVKRRLAVRWTGTLAAWLLLYALSMGPAMALVAHMDWPHDFRIAFAKVVYGPVWWLLTNTPIATWRFIDLYFEAWGHWFGFA